MELRFLEILILFTLFALCFLKVYMCDTCILIDFKCECSTRLDRLKDYKCLESIQNEQKFPNFKDSTNISFYTLVISNKNIPILENSILSGVRISILDLLNSQIAFVEENAFDGIVSLSELSLKSNKIKTTPKPIPSLSHLTLARNQIDHVKSSSFAGMNLLESLDLSSNLINTIDLNAFKDLTRLDVLSLRNNMIKLLGPNLFLKCNHLYSLDLSMNYLSSIESGWFNGLSLIEELSIENNPISIIKNYSFVDMKLLAEISLTSLGLIEIESCAFCGMTNLERLWLGMNKLTHLKSNVFIHQSGSLKVLHLSMNEILNLDLNSFTGLTLLDTLNLSENKITSIDPSLFQSTKSLRDLDLSDNELSLLKNDTFHHLKQIIWLQLDNNDIEDIESASFIASPNSLTFLYMNKNRLTKIKSSYFKNLQNCKQIMLKSNQISIIENDAFEYLNYLENVDLSDNAILFLNSHSFMTYFLSFKQVIRRFNFQNNVLYTIKSDTFRRVSRFLSELDLAHNQIFSIDFDAFDPCKEMYFLSLSSNLLTSLTGRHFLNLAKLLVLELDSNKFTRLESKNFMNLIELNSLDLSKNQISSIHSLAFYDLLELRSLNLAYNRIKTLNRSINILKMINNLNLSYNLIEFIEYEDFKGLNELSQVDFSNNPKIKVINYSRKPLFSNAMAILVLKNVSNNLIDSLNLSTNYMSLTELYLEMSTLLTPISLQKLEYLEVADLSNLNDIMDKISIGSLIKKPELKALDLSNVEIRKFLYIFQNLTENLDSMKVLNLRNVSLTNFESELNGLVRFIKLDTLDLSMNYMTKVLNYYFKFSSQIFFLNLSHNLIETIETGSFVIRTLVTLDLSFNRLKILTQDMFYQEEFNMASLRYVFYQSNQIHTLEICPELFRELDVTNNSLQDGRIYLKCKKTIQATSIVLKVSKNSLKTLSKESSEFIIKEISYLYLNSNEMETIYDEAFVKLNHLLHLDLSENFLGRGILGNHAFKGLYYLETLNLSTNFIQTIHKRLFADLTYLETLDLSHNTIRFIEDFSFKNVNNVKLLHLSFNSDLNSIDSNQTFSGLSSLRNFYMSSKLLNNFTSCQNLKYALNSKMYKASRSNIFYYEAMYLNSRDETINARTTDDGVKNSYSFETCYFILYFIRNNIHLNLKESSDAQKFVTYCQIYFDDYI
jgi:Leucine-rich repeat (LRR) protein